MRTTTANRFARKGGGGHQIIAATKFIAGAITSDEKHP